MLARFLYTTVLLLVQPLVLLRLWWKSQRLPAYRGRILERYGLRLPVIQRPIWIHAVSVGEVLTAKPLVQRYLAQRQAVLITTTTPTGAAQVQRLWGEAVVHRYLPQDIPWCLKRLIHAVQPKCLLIVETELWPNLIQQCARLKVPTVLVNGRLSEKSAKGYARMAAITRPMLQCLSMVLVQSAAEQQRFFALGMEAAKSHVVPSLKFDAEVSEAQVATGIAQREAWMWQEEFVWLAASTHAPEEAMVLKAHQQLLQHHPLAKLIIVPRHPDRFAGVRRSCDDSGLVVSVLSETTALPPSTQVVLADVMGQMWHLLAMADTVVMGNSFNDGGGHNLMEPALLAKPLLAGPANFNFQLITDELADAGALHIVQDEAALVAQLQQLAAEVTVRVQRGAQAQAIAYAHRGGVVQTLALVDTLLS